MLLEELKRDTSEFGGFDKAAQSNILLWYIARYFDFF